MHADEGGMRIGLDVDGVIADNHAAWLERYNEEHGTGWTPEHLTQWEFWNDLGCTRDELFVHWTPSIYTRVRPYEGVLEAVQQLWQRGHSLTYVTACSNMKEYNKKVMWLGKHGFLLPGALVVPVGFDGVTYQTKAEVADGENLQWLVDDSVENCERWPGYALLQTRPHNRNAITTVKRVKSLADVVLLAGNADGEPLTDKGMENHMEVVDVAPAIRPASALPTTMQERKDVPMLSGVLDYFPAALAEVARVSLQGNKQHKLGPPLRWVRNKSNDHGDCVIRHVMDAGQRDTDGQRHSAKAAWRALALLQLECEADGAPLAKAACYEGTDDAQAK